MLLKSTSFQQIRLIPGVTGFWSHEKHGPKPPGTMDSYFLSLPKSSSNESGFSKTPNQPTNPVTAVPEVGIVSEPKTVKEEWPSLPDMSSRRKTNGDLPPHTSPKQKAADLPVPRAAVESTSVAASAEATKPIRVQLSTDPVKAGLDGRVDTELTEVKPARPDSCIDIDENAQSSVADDHKSSSAEAQNHDASPQVEPPSSFDSSSSRVNLTSDEVEDVIATEPQVNAIRQEIPSGKVVSVVDRPLTPSVRLSPAPSGDPKMTVIVANLSKSEPEDSVKTRFRKYGRLVSLSLHILHLVLGLFRELLPG